MTHFKTMLMTAALMVVPSVAFAQIPTDAVTDVVKDKAVETVMDNLTADDTITAGTTMLKGGSKEDAAVAVVKGRVDGKIESMTGGASMEDLSVDGAMDASKSMAADKAHGSASTYTDKSKGSASTYTDKAAGSATSYGAPVIQKSQDVVPTTVAPSVTAISCPAGTKDAGDGTCMITGDFKY